VSEPASLSEAVPASADAALAPALASSESWEICTAGYDDVEAVVAGVRSLLLELGGTSPAEPAMRAAVRSLLDDPSSGLVLVARTQAALVGLLAASWGTAIHVPGAYALIQDLWVDPAWRSQAVGSALVAALFELARERRVERVEVGLPRESFARFAATEAFYLRHGFVANGPRMRRGLP
jgi:GNAT superfamily N-acetyltransferase